MTWRTESPAAAWSGQAAPHADASAVLDTFIEGLAPDHSVLTVVATGDGSPLWSLPSAASSQRLILDLGAKRHRGFWAMQLDTAVRGARRPILLVAEGFACLTIVRWAQLSPRRYVENIAGAMLFSPLSLELEQGPMLRDMYPSPAMPLPFRSLVIDRPASPSHLRVVEMADIWGSSFVDASGLPAAWHAAASQTPLGAASQSIVCQASASADT
jgi:predicted alpha/beta hydrolase family esterase